MSKFKKTLLMLILNGLFCSAFLYSNTFVNPVYASDDEEEEEEEEDEDDDEKEPETGEFELDTFIVNLASGTRYLRVKMSLEYDLKALNQIEKKLAKKSGKEEKLTPSGFKEVPELVAKRNARIKDAVNVVLGSKKANEVLSPEGKDALKTELIEKINDAIGLSDPIVTAIFFTDFIIQ